MAFTRVRTAITAIGVGLRGGSRKRRIFIASGAILLVVLIAGLLVFVFTEEPEETAVGPYKCAELYDEAEKGLSSELAESITQVDGYDTDTGCLYLLVSYSLKSGDSIKARVYYDKLAAVYQPQRGFEGAPAVGYSRLEAIKSELEWREQGREQAKQNDKAFGMPVQ